jgi:rfaE bifunctional protein nucleotidyltransferase chain/domain
VSALVVLDYRVLARRIEPERRAGATLAVTNGCFDLLHVGHVRLIREAQGLADRLLVALNSDATARRAKGEGRPILPLAERMELVAALAGVAYVTSFPEETAGPLLELLRPELHVKGTDWTAETVPEREVVRRYGGRVVIAGDPKTHSSSELIRRLRG